MGAEIEMTEDGHHIVVGGRRWRATDPAIPETLKAQLIGALMDARRAVKVEGDAARHRVQDAKVALGERGDPWWEEATAEGLATRIDSTIRALLRRRPDGTICPSEVSQVVGGVGWRDLMDDVRARAWALRDRGEVDVLQAGSPVDPGARGPIRIGRGSQFPE